MDDQNQNSIITLIYYHFRGLAQNIRYVLYYLDIPFKEIFLKQGQNISSLPILKNHQLHGNSQVPCIVDGKYCIQDCFAIIRYLCVKGKREDLLGSTLEQRTLIREIYYNFLLKKKKCIKLLYKFGQQAASFPQNKEEVRKKALLYFHKQSASAVQTAKIKFRNPNQKYIFNHLTILDFLFYEESFYQVNLFGNLEEKNCKIFQTINSIFGTDLVSVKDKSAILIRVMRQFKESFQKELFYIRNKEKIEQYSVISPSMSKFAKQSFKFVWLGPNHYLNQPSSW